MLGVWLIVIVLACALEIATQVQFISIWAVFGGIAALIADIFGVEQNIQIIIFFAVTFALLALTRPFVSRLQKKIKHIPTNAETNIGKTGHVTKIVNSEEGVFRVTVAGADWSAVMDDRSLPEVGSSVRVERIEGVKLIVTAA